MNTSEKMLYLSSKLMMLSLDREHNKEEIEKVSEKLATMQREAVNEFELNKGLEIQNITVTCGFVKFTKKEISQMPTRFRKVFRLAGCLVHAYKRASGKRNTNYELRYRRDGYNIYVSSNDLEKAKSKFIIEVNIADKRKDLPKVPATFHEFATFYFDKYRIRLVKESTFTNDMYRYKNHLQPYFKSLPLKEIDSDMIQDYIDDYVDNDKMKTAKELKSLLSCIFTNAVDQGLLPRNPCRLVIVESYESEHGIALTIEEENTLIEGLKDNPKYLIPIAVALYTGIRPCEYSTATIEGDFIKAECRKQHSKKVIYKYIPIIPRLKKILNGTSELYFPNKKYLREKLVAFCPTHKLYDLRTTFDTRCETYHVANIARAFWMGHNIDKLRKAYADLPDEFFLNEAEKLDY